MEAIIDFNIWDNAGNFVTKFTKTIIEFDYETEEEGVLKLKQKVMELVNKLNYLVVITYAVRIVKTKEIDSWHEGNEIRL